MDTSIDMRADVDASDYTSFRPDSRPGLRSLFKSAAEQLLASPPAAWLGRRLRAGRRLVLAYHNVVPAGRPGGDRSLHLDFDQFRRQLDALQATTGVTSLEEALSPLGGDPVVAISFDDAYASAVTLALPELATRELPATVFVAPGLLEQGAPWWDQLATDGAMPEAVRLRCLEELGGETSRILAQAGAGSAPGSVFEVATQEQLRHAAALSGVTFGSHSWSHPNLRRQDDPGLTRELRQPLQWLRERFPDIARPWVAYPYGFSDARVEQEAAAVGYTAGFAVTGGWSREPEQRMALSRLNIPSGLSLTGFRARLAGLLGT